MLANVIMQASDPFPSLKMTRFARTIEACVARRAENLRYACLTHDIKLDAGRGIEFGPSNNPVDLPTGVEVTYVDYSRDANASIPGAIPIDHAWSGAGSLSDIIGPSRFDFVIASQVAQYVPNLLGWLRGIHDVVKPGGTLNLSLPDRRFMFDAARNDSTIAELIEAYIDGYDRPSVRQRFSHTYEALAIEPDQIWSGADPRQAPRFCGEHALELAYKEAAHEAESQSNGSCHCWVFTPLSFLSLIEAATKINVFPFILNKLVSTPANGSEFYVSMRRGTEEEAKSLQTAQMNAINHIRDRLEVAAWQGKMLSGEIPLERKTVSLRLRPKQAPGLSSGLRQETPPARMAQVDAMPGLGRPHLTRNLAPVQSLLVGTAAAGVTVLNRAFRWL